LIKRGLKKLATNDLPMIHYASVELRIFVEGPHLSKLMDLHMQVQGLSESNLNEYVK